jgi:putative SOS response-associated peptidase YedK
MQRVTLRTPKQQLLELLQVEEDASGAELGPNFNIAPTRQIYTLAGETGEASRVARQLRVLRWGLVPKWAKSPSAVKGMFNARAESLIEASGEKPSKTFRGPYTRGRRVAIPADGYYEWMQAATGGGRKQPYFITPDDGSLLVFAGLCERWHDKTRDADDPDAWVWSCTIITRKATEEMEWLHERMPVCLPPEAWDAWLDPNTPIEQLDRLLAAQPPALNAYPVDSAVGNVGNNGPYLLEPLPA